MGIRTLECATIQGFEAKLVTLEIALIKGLPAFNITGLANQSVQEAKHRSSSALSAIGFSFPPLKININLSPSDLPKQGSHFDFPIALLIALYHKDMPPFLQNRYFAVGELGLDGKIKDTDSVYPILLDLSTKKYEGIVLVPSEKIEIYKSIPHLRLVAINHLQDALELFDSHQPLDVHVQASHLNFESYKIQGESYYFSQDFKEDFSEILGQCVAKRAALIAASGFHNILFEGSPGCGKSMIAKRMRYILPPLSQEEILKNARMNLYLGQEVTYSPLRPFRSPHASCSKAALLGSSVGQNIKPGEIALASSGILFLDELPHFSMQNIESLREALENRTFMISRAHVKAECEASFLLVCAQNPCPCGHLMSAIHECRCSDMAIAKYRNKLSEPFWDRIDLYVRMQADTQENRVSSRELFEQVLRVFEAQKQRGQKALNAHLHDNEVEEFCPLDEENSTLLVRAQQRFGLSHRASLKTRKVARTIADLDNSPQIQKTHLLEALSYRRT